MAKITDIVSSFGGPVPFAKFFNVPRHTIYTWQRRNYFPPERDLELIAESRRRQLPWTFEDLARARYIDAKQKQHPTEQKCAHLEQFSRAEP